MAAWLGQGCTRAQVPNKVVVSEGRRLPGSIPGSGAFCYLVFGSAMRGVCIDGVLAQCCWFLVAGSIIPCRAFLGRCPDADAAGKSCQWTKQKEEARCGARTRD
jgi:hypothetical protein